MARNLIAALILMASAPLAAQQTPAPAPTITYIHAGHLIDRQPPKSVSTYVINGPPVTARRRASP